MSKARIQKLAFTVLLTASIVIMAVLAVFPYSTVYASELSYDDTNVLDDLRSSTVNGTAFDITDYPFVEGKDPQVINFVEYCYSYRANMRNNFGLYLYVYNPSALNIDTTNANNKVQLATSYNADGEPSDYTKFSLKLCSKVESGDYKNLFYKFKIVDRKVNGTTISERVNSNERRYDVSGIELVTRGNNNATEYTVGGTYKFTGFVKGYGPDASAESTLQCTVKYLETVELNVQHTFYRTLTSSKGAGFQNQLDTVYFAVPKRFFENYGKLQRIKAEWYEYKTKDIVVTSNDDFYNKVKDYIGVETGTPGSYGMPPYNREMYYSLGENAGDWGGGFNGAKWGWNLGEGYLHEPTMALYYLFKTTNIQEYDPYADITSIGGVSSNALYDYILNYNKTTNNGTLPIKDGRISADLFEDDIDEYRKCDTEYGKIQKGYSYYDFDADVDLQKLSAWEAGNQSFWDNWINWGLWNAIVGDIPAEQSQNLSPIYTLKEADLLGTNAQVAERLFVNANDVDDLKQYYRNSKTEDKVVVLFRFATSDYYSSGVDIMELRKGFLGADKHTKNQAYRAWESVFLDFDIIQLTFNKDGVYKVIPVVSSPIDIIDGITPPVQLGDDTWKLILAIILLLLLVMILWPILPFIIRVLIWIVCLPFKAIAAIVKACKKSKERRKENKARELERQRIAAEAEKERQREKEEERERYRKVMQQDYPQDWNDDPFLDAIFDDIDSGRFLNFDNEDKD